MGAERVGNLEKDEGATLAGPIDPEAVNNEPAAAAGCLIELGNANEDAGAFDAALANYQRATELAPTLPRAYLNLGNALNLLGRPKEAIAAYETALRLDPGYAGAHYNLGTLLAKQRCYEPAIIELREALRIRPDMADAAVALANVLDLSGSLLDAEDALRQALQISPNFAGAAHNLALLLAKTERWDEAEKAFEQAIAMDSAYAEPLKGLANLYVKLGRSKDAASLFRRALALRPSFWEAHSNLLFSLNLRDDVNARDLFDEHRRFGEVLLKRCGGLRIPHVNRPDPDRRIRIGYVSGDLRRHPIGLFLRPALKVLDSTNFDAYCYCDNETDDEITIELRSNVVSWRNIAGVDDHVVADMIRADQIDILVDLSGHTSKSRMPVFAEKPAPIQTTWLGYLGTTGLDSMDYRICDRYTDAPGTAEKFHTERLFRMPDNQYCYVPVHDVALSTEPHPNEPRHVVFGSFNQFAKISDTCLDLWCDVLRRVPTATLRVLDVPAGKTMQRFLARVELRGINTERIATVGRLDILQYFAAISDVDIALDTLPYTGGTTTLDTLWMGVPLVAIPGELSVARTSYSILSTLGMPELIAQNRTEYIERNVTLAEDNDWRGQLRRSLRTRMEGSPLMNAERFVGNLEAGYREMWREWCRTQSSRG